MSEVLSNLLRPFSWLYAMAVVVRNWCYDVGLLRAQEVDVPVISIGNLTSGGTGKTPFVEFLVRFFQSRGKRVTILSRGYKRRSRGLQVVSDGARINGNARAAGDEPFQLARKFPSASVVVDRKRVRGARFACKNLHPEVIILDDGFQHRHLRRNLDIVMVDGRTSLNMVRMLPAGLRREPLRSLCRANALVFTGAEPSNGILGAFRKCITVPTATVRLIPMRLRPVAGGSEKPLDEVRGTSCVAFCGIGSPASFRSSLDEIGLHVKAFLAFPDHRWFGMADLMRIERAHQNTKSELIVTTEKDAARLLSLGVPEFLRTRGCYFLEVEAAIERNEAMLVGLLEPLVEGNKQC